MRYISTRGQAETYSGAEVILHGLARDGGLFVPEYIPVISPAQWRQMLPMSYPERAYEILSLYLDFEPHLLRQALAEAYHEERFAPSVAPLHQLNPYSDLRYMLELWHGPSGAFKDIALQLLPRLITLAKDQIGDDKHYCFVTATSGDTGIAAMEGFCEVEDTSVVVFYPKNGVSDVQEQQMLSVDSPACYAIPVQGNFDEAQTKVKEIFSDRALADRLAEKNIRLSSANSINWGRLLPQIVYYASAYLDLLALEKLEEDETFDVVVPTGNFGNILSAWYAKQMGVPIANLFCASNKNRVLTDFLRNGEYDRRRKLVKTNSPAMDIVLSSNVERLIFELSGRDSEQTRQWMEDVHERGKYKVDKETLQRITEEFRSGYADDQVVLKTIREVYDAFDHVVDPHTAVGFTMHARNTSNFKPEQLKKTVFVSTASPFKFPETVAQGLFSKRENQGKSIEALSARIAEESGLEIPEKLVQASQKLHTSSPGIHVDEMAIRLSEVLL